MQERLGYLRSGPKGRGVDGRCAAKPRRGFVVQDASCPVLWGPRGATPPWQDARWNRAWLASNVIDSNCVFTDTKNRRCLHRPRTHWDNAKVRPYRVRGNVTDSTNGNKNSANRETKNEKNTATKMTIAKNRMRDYPKGALIQTFSLSCGQGVPP